MYLNELFSMKNCVFSIEVFPPKKNVASLNTLYPKLKELAALSPDFISVTYGAGGNVADDSTCQIAAYIKRELGIESLAHLTCVNSEKEQIQDTLQQLRQNGIENVLALRGDINPNLPRKTDYRYASELASVVHESGFNVVGACYPEGHVESDSLRQDVENLHYKIEAGVTHLITQLFFDNGVFYRFLNLARKAGVSVPIEAGVMPIVSKTQVERTVALSSASLPSEFTKMISKYDHDEQGLFDAGIDYAIRQIRDLIEGGTDGIHLYAMNRPMVARKVYEGIKDLL
ncbi:methylenetetrahydrofolate reductase [NAD(P)H] [uncultured Ruthenibacterium sp.]|uniref:methylenetetrahydrofolate reductase [NAD(P)H] n=1 Tax=uncultured Ruthenibacterium sp. TaxID=1905347 RepID=UPI00349ED723